LHKPIPPLHTIVLTSSNWDELSAVGEVLRTLGPSLRHLDLTFPYAYSVANGTQLYFVTVPFWLRAFDTASTYSTIDLSRNTELRTLALGKIGNVTLHWNAGAHIPSILSGVTSRYLETVTLTFFDVKSSRQLPDAVWANINRAFELPVYEQLRKIRIVVDGVDDEDIQLTIWQHLYSCDARGWLTFG
jgi:hypothetical protein